MAYCFLPFSGIYLPKFSLLSYIPHLFRLRESPFRLRWNVLDFVAVAGALAGDAVREQGSEKVGCNRGPKSFAWFCFGFVFPSSFFQYIEFIQTHSVTRAVCWLPDQSHLNMQKVRSECGRSEWATPHFPLALPRSLDNHAQNAESFHPADRAGTRRTRGWSAGQKLLHPRRLHANWLKCEFMWEILFALVMHSHIHTGTRKTRQNDLAAYANWSQLADWHFDSGSLLFLVEFSTAFRLPLPTVIIHNFYTIICDLI